SLGKSSVQVTSSRKDTDSASTTIRAPNNTENRLDALLSELDDNTGLTQVDDMPRGARRDPISDIIRTDRRKYTSPARVPSLDDPDDDDDATPLPPPSRGMTASDEAAAFAAISDLDEPARRMTSAAEQAA